VDVVFTSNFFEHLPDKAALRWTLDQIKSSLRPGGRLIAMGPNIKCVPGAYWDFWDHYLPLTEMSLQEALENRGFRMEKCLERFLPYTMAGKKPTPLALIRLYLALPPAWKLLGKQFLVVAATASPRISSADKRRFPQINGSSPHPNLKAGKNPTLSSLIPPLPLLIYPLTMRNP